MSQAIVFDIQRTSINDGPGIRTCVFLKGCGLSCVWCHNPESQAKEPQIGYFEHRCSGCGVCTSINNCHAHSIINGKHSFDRTRCNACGKCTKLCPTNALKLYGHPMDVFDVFTTIMQDSNYYRSSGGGVTLSGGEPLLQLEFCTELLSLCKKNHVHTAVETSGFIPRANFEKIVPLVDLFLFDIKHYSPESHRKLTGKDNSTILKNLEYLNTMQKPTIIRSPIIPDLNDNPGFIDFLMELRVTYECITGIELLPYHDMGKEKWNALGMKYSLQCKPLPSNKYDYLHFYCDQLDQLYCLDE